MVICGRLGKTIKKKNLSYSNRYEWLFEYFYFKKKENMTLVT